MDRSILSDEQFERVAPHLPGKVGDPGRTANNRLFLEAVFWIARTGAPWRDLGPRIFGLWNSVYRRFPTMGGERRIRESLQAVVPRPGLRIRHHRRHHRPGPPAWHRRKGGTQNQAIGRSRGGLTTKIVALVDALGNLTRFLLLPGQRHDSIGVAPLIEIAFEVLAERPSTRLDPRRMDSRGAMAVIPPKADRVRSMRIQMAPSRREFLLRSQAVPAHRHEIRKNRHELCRDDTPRRLSPRTQMNVHRP